jgi:DNA mismatch repair protein MutH
MRPPPRSAEELLGRARALAGSTVQALALRTGVDLGEDGVRTKGQVGALVERALGATGGPAATWDFPELGVELKTVPMGGGGIPRESTFVCTLSLGDAESAEWGSSWVRAKLSRVLWVPVHGAGVDRRLGEPLLWAPTPAQERGLAADFEEIVGRIGAGGIESVGGRLGRWLQVRPKAADGASRTTAWGPEGEAVRTVPRGFYLRARFTAAILGDPGALPP